MAADPAAPVVPFVQLHDRWLRVELSVSPPLTADFHYQWLRGQCDADRHPLTRERILDLSQVPTTIAPLSAQVVPAAASGEPAALVVRWNEPGERTSRYPLDWLREHAYAINQPAPTPPPSAVASLMLHAADYGDERSLVTAALARLADAGAVVVRGYRAPASGDAAPADTEALITAFAAAGLAIIGTHFGRIEDLRTDNTTNQNNDQLGYTDAAIAAHTDQPFLTHPPRYQLLHCMRAAATGGDNYVVDGLLAARYLEAIDAEAFATLCRTPVHFHRRQRQFESLVVAPILHFGEDGFLIRYSYFTMAPQRLPFAQMDGWFRAYRRFAEIVRDPAHHYSLRLLPGDFLLYDNHRMLHARTAFTGSRWVRGVYFNPAVISTSL